MAGHSHFANIARKKAIIDNKRGKLWSKLSKAIIVAAKMGGGDPDMNIRLRAAIDAAKAVSMPKDNISRAIKKGTGELDGGNLEEILYEGYGPNGVAVLCEVWTDNRNRTAPEVCNGNLGGTGCVAWIFETKGYVAIDATKTTEDALLELALEAGADDVKRVEAQFEIICTPDNFQSVLEALSSAKIPTDAAEMTRIPTTTVELDADQGEQVLKLIELLDDHEDVQSVYSNFNIPDEAMAQLAAR